MGSEPSDAFTRASAGRRPSLVAEFWEFLRYNKKWWLLPILMVFVLLGALMLLAGSGAAPFIYTLF